MKVQIAGAALALALVGTTVGPAAAGDRCGRLCEHRGPWVDDSRWEHPPEFAHYRTNPPFEEVDRLLDGAGANLLDKFGR